MPSSLAGVDPTDGRRRRPVLAGAPVYRGSRVVIETDGRLGTVVPLVGTPLVVTGAVGALARRR